MSKSLLLTLFTLAVIVQISIPGQMVWQYEDCLNHGAVYRFHTAPLDPYDAFRGRYLWLAVRPSEAAIQPEANWQRGDTAYVPLSVDPQGYAQFGEIARTAPKEGDYLKTRIFYPSDKTVQLDLPFDRFYLDEKDAPRAETIQRKFNNAVETYIIVRVKNGYAVIEDLILGGIPLRQRLEEGEVETISGR